MRVSVVLCTYSLDAYDHFEEAAESVLAQTHDDVELVVVVDGTEAVYRRVEDDFGDREDVVTHLNEENYGLLESRNRGAELASGDVVAFIDDDAVADERWIEELVRAYGETGAVAAGGKMTPEWVAGRPTYLPEEFYWLVGVTHRGFADGPGEVRNTFGSNISFRRDVFLDLGGFETDIGGRRGDANLQGGETELCARMRAEYGRGVMYTPDAEVAHKVFEYRTRIGWLLDRAFWQGYSKRGMAVLVPESTGDESDFLGDLLTRFVPDRLAGLLADPSVEKLAQLIAVFVLTAAVGAGYLYGVLKWRGRDRRDGTDGESLPDVCVVTHPLAAAGENATRSLLDVVGSITGVALVTADLPADSEIRGRFPVVELTREGAGGSVAAAASRFLLNQLRMCRVLRRRDEPVVLFFGATAYVLPIAFARLLGRRVVVEPRGDVPLTLRLDWEERMPAPLARLLAAGVRALERLGFALAHGVVTYTPGMAEQLGLDPADEGVYPSGARYVRTDEFAVETPYAERGRRIGFLGRLDGEKNVRELAAVARELPPDVTFTFVGDGDLHGWLETRLDAEIAAGRVELRGWVDHGSVPAELNRLGLLVLPSEPTEGLPTSILEAMACGTPVCATPVSGVPDVVRDGETGFLLERTDPDYLRRKLLSVLDRDDLPEISRNGRRLIEEEYSLDAATRRYREILRAVAG